MFCFFVLQFTNRYEQIYNLVNLSFNMQSRIYLFCHKLFVFFCFATFFLKQGFPTLIFVDLTKTPFYVRISHFENFCSGQSWLKRILIWFIYARDHQMTIRKVNEGMEWFPKSSPRTNCTLIANGLRQAFNFSRYKIVKSQNSLSDVFICS